MNFACQFFICRHPEPDRDGQAQYEGQNPRPLQENGTARSKSQALHIVRRKPWAT